MGAMASQITSLKIVYSTIYSGADQRKYQSSMSLAFVRGIQRRPVNSPHKGPVTRKMFPFDDIIMSMCLNTMRSRQNGRHFTDNSFKCVFLNEVKWLWILINIPLEIVPKGPINNIPPLVQIMAWHQPGAKPLSEPMMVRLPPLICVTRT